MAHFRLTIKYLYIFLIDTPISFLYLNDANYCLGVFADDHKLADISRIF